MRISVFGLGKLGSPLAAILAARGFEVVGVDTNPGFVEALNAGRAPVAETGLQEMIDSAETRLSATTDAATAVAGTDATFIIVPTPSLSDGKFSLAHVLEAAKAIGEGIAAKDGHHLVVLTSTVMPGDTEGRLKPALEAHSGKRCGEGFGLCYSPEFVALGSVVNDLLNPDFVLVGESDARSGDLLAGIYAQACRNDPPVARMNFVNAELAKLAINNFLTARISYANMLAQLCEKLPGADVDVVTGALGLDSRIGHKYLRGAVGFGGPCLPRDNLALGTLARGLGCEPTISQAARDMNRMQLEHLAATVARHAAGGTVGILGLSYKADTPVVAESPSIDLARRLSARGQRIVAYDPQAVPAARALLRDTVAFAGSAAECAGQSDVLVVMVPWAEFRSLGPGDLKAGKRRPTVIDCWRILPREAFADACTYIALGQGPAQARAAAQDGGGDAVAGGDTDAGRAPRMAKRG